MSQDPSSFPKTVTPGIVLSSSTVGTNGLQDDTPRIQITSSAATSTVPSKDPSDAQSTSRLTQGMETHDSYFDSSNDPELAGLDALEDAQPGERPAYPFTTLIRYAIKGSPNSRLLLEDIYNAIQNRYPFFNTAPAGWKNSVRHTLSLMTCFEKVPRLLTEPGKGSYWTVNDSMPHAKPSRVRVRKRKTRADEDGPATPKSVPDPLQAELPSNGDDDTQLPPSERSIVFTRRHSSYVHGDVANQYTDYSYGHATPNNMTIAFGTQVEQAVIQQ